MPITHIQSSHNALGSISTINVPVSGLTAGNLVIVGAWVNSTTHTLSASATGVMFSTATGPNADSIIRSYIFVGVVGTGGATSITITRSAGFGSLHVWVMEFSGLETTGFLDTAGHYGNGNNAIALPNTNFAGRSQSSELLVGHWALGSNSGSQIAGTGWTLVHTATNRSVVGQWKIVNDTTTHVGGMTIGSPNNYIASYVSLKALDLGIVPQLHHRAMSV